jgi:hypothetical protein
VDCANPSTGLETKAAANAPADFKNVRRPVVVCLIFIELVILLPQYERTY